MSKKLFFLSLKAFLILILFSCNKGSDLTSILEDPDPIIIDFDEVLFRAETYPSDSSLTYNDSAFIPSYFIGQTIDPYFGQAVAGLNFQVGIFTEPDLSGASLDSVILSLEYDTTMMRYGAMENAPIGFQIFEITQDLSTDENYFSNSPVEVNPEPIGEVIGLVPNLTDTVFVAEPQSLRTDTVAYKPHLRIKLNRIGRDLIQLTQDDFASVSIFQEKFKGISLRPTEDCEGALFFEMFSGLTRLNLYYTTAGDTARLLQMPVLESSCATFNTYEHNFTGSEVEKQFQEENVNDSILYLQSMQGPDILLTMGDLGILDQSTVNYAELQLNLLVPNEGDTTLNPPIEQLIIQELREDGTKVEIVDVILAAGNQLGDFFGGDLEYDGDTGITSYQFNITRHFQKILSGEASNKMIITNLFKGAQPNRSILYGKSNNPLSAKIKVTHTSIN
ncbi:MAG: DUF4270 family protein [Saprospiraceae bacterium]|nr:DUF4270 family protein [Saprospiraceae bacterium]